ncbi:MAG: flagellar hook-associated protein FlgL [Candidatus Cloacimonetes bacterium]|nr:flagellar hook-associated protein FlgL [Candidatus Cloacimonadota bacterium]
MRITDSVMFNMLNGHVSKNLDTFRRLQQMISSEQKLLVPSDDPEGIALSTSYRNTLSSYVQYEKNLQEAEEFLQATDSTMMGISDLLAKARELAEYNATGTVSETERLVAAQEVDHLISQVIDLANTTVRDRYIFGGYQTDTPTYDSVGRIVDPYVNPGNEYEGEATASGTYTGTQNASYIVRIVAAGSETTAQFQVSEDGGETWSNVRAMASQINVYDDVNGTDKGVRLNFTAGTFAEGDEFFVNVDQGKYQGDSGNIEYNINKNSRLSINITAGEALESSGVMDALYRLKYALQHNNQQATGEVLAELDTAHEVLENSMTTAGIRLQRIEVARNNLTALQENLHNSIEYVEKPDLFRVISDLAAQEVALQASTQMLGSVFPVSLLNYI